MSTRVRMGLAAVCAGMLLAGCGEKPQAMGGIKSDAPPHVGVGASQYVQPGWTVGDRTAWQQQLKARAAYGQNEYSRVTN